MGVQSISRVMVQGKPMYIDPTKGPSKNTFNGNGVFNPEEATANVILFKFVLNNKTMGDDYHRAVWAYQRGNVTPDALGLLFEVADKMISEGNKTQKEIGRSFIRELLVIQEQHDKLTNYKTLPNGVIVGQLNAVFSIDHKPINLLEN